jgi:2-dehydropantoate 2-reductase
MGTRGHAWAEKVCKMAIRGAARACRRNAFMKVCVFGAGAVGGHVAARLLAAGRDEVSVIARGVQLQALRSRGLTLHMEGREIHASVPVATDDPSSLPGQDVVLVALKATAGLSAAAGAIAGLIGPEGCAVFLVNGIPWWWRHGLAGPQATLPLLDATGALWQAVRPERTLGCVVYCPNEIRAPGVIVHTGINHFILGEPDGRPRPRLEAVAGLLRRAGIDTRISPDIRSDIWEKVSQNAAGNALSALTRLDLAQIGGDEGLRALSIQVMHETLEVAVAQGWDLRARIDLAQVSRRGKPGQRTSMLQDVLQGRMIEVEPLLGQVQLFAREAAVPVPAIDVLLPLLRGLAASLAR